MIPLGALIRQGYFMPWRLVWLVGKIIPTLSLSKN